MLELEHWFKTGEITAEKLSSLKGIGVYVTGQQTG